MAVFAEDQKFKTVTIHGVNENAQPEFLDVHFSRLSFDGSLTIYGGPGGIMLEVLLPMHHEFTSSQQSCPSPRPAALVDCGFDQFLWMQT